MLRTCFVARLIGDQKKSVELFCRFEPTNNSQTKLPDLPSAQNLGTFCYPVGASNVKPREYGAPEVCARGSYGSLLDFKKAVLLPNLMSFFQPCGCSPAVLLRFTLEVPGSGPELKFVV